MDGGTVTLVVNGTVGRGTFRRAVSLSVEAGSAVGLVGANGAGKSTVLSTIAGLDRMVEGSVVIDGQVLDGPGTFVEPEDRRAVVVFQDLRLFPHMSVIENVAFGPRCHGAPRAEAGERAADALAKVGLAGFGPRSPLSLSGGERQRVALARAIVTNPRVLLLDEPFAAVDAASRPGLRETLAGILADSKAHTVLVSHDPTDLSGLTVGTVELG